MSDKPEDHYDPRSDAAKKLGEYPYFTARPVSTIDNSPASNSYVIGVFEHRADDGNEIQIGSYERNYGFLRTFWWFRRGSRHFALYSPDYTATRIMEILPGRGFDDIGGEEPASDGFCPVEFYIPDCREYRSQEYSGLGEQIGDWADPLASLPAGCEFQKEAGTHRGTAKLRGADGRYIEQEVKRKGFDGTESVVKVPVWGEQQDYESGWIKFPPDHGFVFGCFWACPYQIQYLDLSRVEEGIILREERFGYIELPQSVLLRDAIRIHGLSETPKVDITISTQWDLRTGKMKPLQP